LNKFLVLTRDNVIVDTIDYQTADREVRGRWRNASSKTTWNKIAHFICF